EIAAAAAGHQDLLAGLVGMVNQQHAAPACGALRGAHQAGGAGADDHHIAVHSRRTRSERPLILPSDRRLRAWRATLRSTATRAWKSNRAILPTWVPASPASPVNAPRISPGRSLSLRPAAMHKVTIGGCSGSPAWGLASSS